MWENPLTSPGFCAMARASPCWCVHPSQQGNTQDQKNKWRRVVSPLTGAKIWSAAARLSSLQSRLSAAPGSASLSVPSITGTAKLVALTMTTSAPMERLRHINNVTWPLTSSVTSCRCTLMLGI